MGYSKNIGHNLATQIYKLIFGVLAGVLVARALGPAGQGYVAYILVIFNLLGTFGSLGINSAVAYFQKKSGFERTAIFSSNMSILGIFSLCLILLVFLTWRFGIALDSYDLPYIIGGVILMVSTMFTMHHQAWLTGDEKIIKNNKIGLIVFSLRSLAIFGFWVFGILTPLSFFYLNALGMLLWLILIHISLRENYIALISIRVIKAELKYGAFGWWSALFAFLQLRVDQLMIRQYWDVSNLGVYSIAVMIAELLFLLPVSITGALIGRLYNLPAGDDGRMLTARTIRLSFYICLLLALVGVLGSFLIPIVYGAPYASATTAMIILLPGILFACIPKIASPWFYAEGKPQIHLYITLAAFITNLVANLLLIPKYGINGAAFASSISYILYGAWYLGQLAWGERFGIRSLLIPDLSDWQIISRLVKSGRQADSAGGH